jgi:hypothetical protein
MHYIDFIKSCGYRVFVRDLKQPTYCYYTDGINIGYAQWCNDPGVSTIHKPNKHCGTGFKVSDSITAMNLKAGFSVAPEWATQADRQEAAKQKYADWNEFARSKHNQWSNLYEV